METKTMTVASKILSKIQESRKNETLVYQGTDFVGKPTGPADLPMWDPEDAEMMNLGDSSIDPQTGTVVYPSAARSNPVNPDELGIWNPGDEEGKNVGSEDLDAYRNAGARMA